MPPEKTFDKLEVKRKIAEIKEIPYMRKFSTWQIIALAVDRYYNRRMESRRHYGAVKQMTVLLLTKQGNKCYYCPKILDKKTSTIDLIIPSVRGGKVEPSNIVVACNVCNSMKSMFTADEYFEFIGKVEEKFNHNNL